MSIEAWRAVLYRSRATGAAFKLLMIFADFGDDTGLCWPSASTLARLGRCNLRNAKKAIAALVAAGELIAVGAKKRGVVVYRIAACDPDYVGSDAGAGTPTSVEIDTGACDPTSVEIDTGANHDQCRKRHPTSVENDTRTAIRSTIEPRSSSSSASRSRFMEFSRRKLRAPTRSTSHS